MSTPSINIGQPSPVQNLTPVSSNHAVSQSSESSTSIADAAKSARSLNTNATEGTQRQVNVSTNTPADNIQQCFQLNAINATAATFLGNKALTGQIKANFAENVKTLQNWVEALPVSDLTGEGKANTANALSTLFDLIQRYNSNALGGFNRLQPSESIHFKAAINYDELAKAAKKTDRYDDLKEKHKTAKEDLDKAKAAKAEDAEIKKLEAAANIKSGAVKDFEKSLREEQLSVLQGQAKTMLASLVSGQKISNAIETLSPYKVPSSEAEVRAQFLNILQQVSLSAWIFNDIKPAFAKTGINAALPGDLASTAELNNKARGTHMFSELRPPTGDPAKAEWNEFFSSDEGAAFKGLKLGLRGRGNWGNKDTEVEQKPIYNRKSESECLIKDDLTELKAGFVPGATARLTTVPQAMCDALNTSNYENLKNYLVEKGVAKAEDGKLSPLPSYAAIIDSAGLPTYCSVSGTTGELVSTLLTTGDSQTKEQLQGCLNSLLEIARGATNKNERLSDFNKFFAPIATFMEIGHFHTSAEVLGGFYSVAVANNPAAQGTNMQTGFKNLLEYFKANTDQFLAS